MIAGSGAPAIEGVVTVIEIRGELDSRTAASFENDIEFLLSRGKRFIVLNGKNLKYLSSEGIGTLLYAARMVFHNDGLMVVCDVCEEVKSLLEVLNIHKFLKIVNTKQEAVDLIKNEFFHGRPSEEKEPLFVKLNNEDINQEKKKNLVTETNDRENTSSRNESERNESKITTETQEKPVNAAKKPGEFEYPIVVECSNCGSYLRVRESGKFMCPTCQTEFNVENDGTVVF